MSIKAEIIDYAGDTDEQALAIIVPLSRFREIWKDQEGRKILEFEAGREHEFADDLTTIMNREIQHGWTEIDSWMFSLLRELQREGAPARGVGNPESKAA
ncbi:hypothetical protein [Methylosinus sp. PW1]|uniref:hypothetical protein n=1 Tax=Methylosinus sp. PW1 TaxID=107636 RepID=UPI00055D8908|nr:hypothetical protein [Methylosinus sp. PW1]